MKHGLEIITFNNLGDPNLVVDLAIAAEESGWDGIFLPDHLVWRANVQNIIDPWITLSAIAARTSKLKLICITPITRRQPWVIAKQLATLDVLSKGRVILGTGIGSPARDFTAFGLEYNPKDLARKLDEGLAILQGLWSGKPFSFKGEFYSINDVTFTPTPYQKSRIPIVLGGWWPKKNPIKRGAKWDGIMPIPMNYPKQFTLDELHELLDFYKALRPKNDLGEICIKINRSKERDEFNESCKQLGVTWAFEILTDINWSFGGSDKPGNLQSYNAMDRQKQEFMEFVKEGPYSY